MDKQTDSRWAVSVVPIATILFLLLFMGIFSILKPKKIYSDIKKIAPYLYEITYSDYREDLNNETHSDMEVFGCSSVKNGNFYGRNFDYIFNDTP